MDVCPGRRKGQAAMLPTHDLYRYEVHKSVVTMTHHSLHTREAYENEFGWESERYGGYKPHRPAVLLYAYPVSKATVTITGLSFVLIDVKASSLHRLDNSASALHYSF